MTLYWWSTHTHSDVSGWTTGVPPHCRGVAGWTSHQTVWVILSPRRDPHRKSNHQSTAFTAHRPAGTTPHSLLSDGIYSLNNNNCYTRRKTWKVSCFTDNGWSFFFLFSFTFCEEGGRRGQLARDVERNTATTWRWRSSYFGQEVRKKVKKTDTRERFELYRQVWFYLATSFRGLSVWIWWWICWVLEESRQDVENGEYPLKTVVRKGRWAEL